MLSIREGPHPLAQHVDTTCSRITTYFLAPTHLSPPHIAHPAPTLCLAASSPSKQIHWPATWALPRPPPQFQSQPTGWRINSQVLGDGWWPSAVQSVDRELQFADSRLCDQEDAVERPGLDWDSVETLTSPWWCYWCYSSLNALRAIIHNSCLHLVVAASATNT